MKRSSFPLWVKLNLLIAGLILVLAVGLQAISYFVFRKTADSVYYERLNNAAESAIRDLDAETVLFLREAFLSEEYQTLRRAAAATGDLAEIRAWMRWWAYGSFLEAIGEADGEESALSLANETLAEAYAQVMSVLAAIKGQYGIQAIYLQYDTGGRTWNLADPDEDLLWPGSAESPISAFASYAPNAEIPPTIYHSQFGWLCTVCLPFFDAESGELLCYIGADVDMNAVMEARHSFFVQSGFLVFLLIAAAIAVSAVFLSKTVTGPLRQLTAAATSFSGGENGYTKDDIISLPIDSRDEIGDLYREIRSMERRIVTYTDHLTQATAERERVSTELHTAAQIQSAMLPSVFPPFPGRREFDLFASMTPAKQVGGDFYDFFFVDEDHLALVMADVSDKGVPAALFMMASMILINFRARQGGGPAEILADVNRELSGDNPSSMFVTVWLGILELSTGRMRCCNAGHEKPFLRRGGKFLLFADRHGPMVGGLPGVRYPEYEVTLAPGDGLFVYTDGVPEAQNAGGEFFGLARTEEVLNAAAGASPEETVLSVQKAAARFAGNAKQFDDMTMLCLAYHGPAGGDAGK